MPSPLCCRPQSFHHQTDACKFWFSAKLTPKQKCHEQVLSLDYFSESAERCCSGALLWFCCRRRSHQDNSPGKLQLPKEETGSPWAASASALVKRPFRKAPPKNLVASKAVDLTPAVMDPEQPSFTTGPNRVVPPPGQTPVKMYTQQMPADYQAENPPAAHQSLDQAAVVGSGVGQDDGLLKAGLPHSDSAVSLPSYASSVQAPGTPIAPAVIGTGESS